MTELKQRGLKEPTTITEIIEFVTSRYSYLEWKVEMIADRRIVVCHPTKKVDIELYPMTINDGSHRISVSIQDNNEGHCGPLESYDVVKAWIDRELEKLGMLSNEVQMSIFDVMT